MSATVRRTRSAALLIAVLFVLSPLATVARAGEEAPPQPDPGPGGGCISQVVGDVLGAFLELGSGVLTLVF